MAKFNPRGTRVAAALAAPISFINTEPVASGTTFNGAPGFARDLKSELFLLAVANFVSEDTFYEKGTARDDRFKVLVRQAAVADPDWTQRFIGWLRREAHMRSAPIMAAAEAVKALVEAHVAGSRRIVDVALQRPDEPGEIIGYWLQHYGKKMPKPFKRGVADAAVRLYTEYGLLKYDTDAHAVRFADVIRLAHVTPKEPDLSEVRAWTVADIARQRNVDPDVVLTRLHEAAEDVQETEKLTPAIMVQLHDFVYNTPAGAKLGWRTRAAARVIGLSPNVLVEMLERRATPDARSPQSYLFKHAMNRRYGIDNLTPRQLMTHLPMVYAQHELRQKAAIDPKVLLDPEALRQAGMTWEDALSLWGNRPDKGKLWDALIPTMGYFAILRNLRNFTEHGISPASITRVVSILTDAQKIAKSQLFPFRFLSAYRSTQHTLQWGPALEQALNMSLGNVPVLPGRTLVLVDRSGSMFDKLSAKSDLTRADAAAIFGVALTLRNLGNVDLVQFGNQSFQVQLQRGESLLHAVNTKFSNLGGTATAAAIRNHFRGHDRIIIITDEQANYHGGSDVYGVTVPYSTWCYTWNLAGYVNAHANTMGRKFAFGGLSDSSFKLISLLEAGESQTWPF